jgi:uncharacterized membrane protein
MPSPRRFLLLLAVVALVVLPVLPSGATTVACEKFEVGSDKWQQCLEDTVNDAFDNSDKDKGKGGGGGQKDDDTGGGTGGDECSAFDVGSAKWSECIQDRFTGNLPKGPEGAACSEFSVGSDEWTECIEGAATGGGLMPWIVIIPLGVMVLGMIFMFARQASRARRMEGFSSARIGSGAGGWLIFMAFIEGSMGVGMAVAESRASGSGGGYFIAAVTLIGVAVLMLIIGIVVSIKSRKKRKIEVSGSPGQATVLNLSQTGTYINENPQFMFELDVNVPGMAQFRTTQRATVPMYLVQAVGPGAVLPVKVDPSDPSEVVIDWSGVTLNRAATPAWGTPAATTPLGTVTPGSTPFGTTPGATPPGGASFGTTPPGTTPPGTTPPGTT